MNTAISAAAGAANANGELEVCTNPYHTARAFMYVYNMHIHVPDVSTWGCDAIEEVNAANAAAAGAATIANGELQ